jgi:hypothetical protein
VGETMAGKRFRRPLFIVVLICICDGPDCGCGCPNRQDKGRWWCVGDVGGELLCSMLLVIMRVGLAEELRRSGCC